MFQSRNFILIPSEDLTQEMLDIACSKDFEKLNSISWVLDEICEYKILYWEKDKEVFYIWKKFAELSAAQKTALSIIKRNPGYSGSEISIASGNKITKSHVYAILDKLQENFLIRIEYKNKAKKCFITKLGQSIKFN